MVPGIRAAQLKRLFAECGWRVLEVKYGHLLQEQFQRPGGGSASLHRRHEQRGLPSADRPARPRRTPAPRQAGRFARDAVLAAVDNVPDDGLPAVLSNLGGHDLHALIQTFDQAQEDLSRPTVIFAYTIKGWGLPIAGDPLNHSKLLTAEQIDDLQRALSIEPGQEWQSFAPSSPVDELCRATARRLYPDAPRPSAQTDLHPVAVPNSLSVRSQGLLSTQQALGQLLMSISRVPGLSERVVTISPDVSTSTNLSGWIIKNGVFKPEVTARLSTDEQQTFAWREGPSGQHIELGISEMNLFMALGMFGLTHSELSGQRLIPIGTVYDPFICRGLDSLIYALYSGAKFIFAGTPSGISLSPEGGAHQSTVTPSLGIELPGLVAFEPAFAKEMEWMMIEALRQCCSGADGTPSTSG